MKHGNICKIFLDWFGSGRFSRYCIIQIVNIIRSIHMKNTLFYSEDGISCNKSSCWTKFFVILENYKIFFFSWVPQKTWENFDKRPCVIYKNYPVVNQLSYLQQTISYFFSAKDGGIMIWVNLIYFFPGVLHVFCNIINMRSNLAYRRNCSFYTLRSSAPYKTPPLSF